MPDAHFRKSAYKNSPFSAVAYNIADIKVLKSWRGFSNRWYFYCLILFRRLRKIVHIKKNRIADNIFHADIFDINILNNSSASPCRFEAESVVCTNERTIIDKNVSGASTHF